MTKNTVKIEGMACTMCEAHINEVIRRVAPGAKKVSSSHIKGETTFLTEEPVPEEALRQGIDATGYRFVSYTAEPYQKKGLFGR